MKKARTKYGILSGVEHEGCAAFFGVPYAQPPVGELRWKAPREPESWEGERDASAFSNRAWQLTELYKEDPNVPQGPGINYGREFYANPDFMPPMDEDCLYLNIWTPAKSEEEKLPVAFWIHGGAFLNGFGSELEFDGKAFAKKGVILVTINYRLGALGFLAHEALRDEQGLTGNYGILDQIAALKWVRENISAFGGDPDRITIFGQSAGAMSVQTLLSSPLTKGMIAGAILQSGGGYHGSFSNDVPLETALQIGRVFSKVTGANTAEELRALTPRQVTDVLGAMGPELQKLGIQGLPFVPVIDGHTLVKGYQEWLHEGCHPDIPYMLGSCGDDLFQAPDASEEHSPLYYSCVNWSLNDQNLGRRPAYVYYFDRKLPGSGDGAFHSAELWYVFKTLDRSWRPSTEGDYALAERINSYWVNFVKTGDPNGGDLPRWEPCTWETHHVQTLDITAP